MTSAEFAAGLTLEECVIVLALHSLGYRNDEAMDDAQAVLAEHVDNWDDLGSEDKTLSLAQFAVAKVVQGD